MVEISDGLVCEGRMNVGLLDWVMALPVGSSFLWADGVADVEPVHPPCKSGRVGGT